jgi:hypothetical protein
LVDEKSGSKTWGRTFDHIKVVQASICYRLERAANPVIKANY